MKFTDVIPLLQKFSEADAEVFAMRYGIGSDMALGYGKIVSSHGLRSNPRASVIRSWKYLAKNEDWLVSAIITAINYKIDHDPTRFMAPIADVARLHFFEGTPENGSGVHAILRDIMDIFSLHDEGSPRESVLLNSEHVAIRMSAAKALVAKSGLAAEASGSFSDDIVRTVKSGSAKKNHINIFLERIGLSGSREFGTLSRIGEHYDLTRERIRQISDKALKSSDIDKLSRTFIAEYMRCVESTEFGLCDVTDVIAMSPYFSSFSDNIKGFVMMARMLGVGIPNIDGAHICHHIGIDDNTATAVWRARNSLNSAVGRQERRQKSIKVQSTATVFRKNFEVCKKHAAKKGIPVNDIYLTAITHLADDLRSGLEIKPDQVVWAGRANGEWVQVNIRSGADIKNEIAFCATTLGCSNVAAINTALRCESDRILLIKVKPGA